MSPRDNPSNRHSFSGKQHNSPVPTKNSNSFFINRRASNRRSELDPCNELPVDLYNRKRRKSTDRRNRNKTLADDFYSVTKN
ncbi:MAG: hypothetical protein ACRBCS_01460 [Cellvibrionaceae bacterium]